MYLMHYYNKLNLTLTSIKNKIKKYSSDYNKGFHTKYMFKLYVMFNVICYVDMKYRYMFKLKNLNLKMTRTITIKKINIRKR